MTGLRIVLEADGQFPEMAGKTVHRLDGFAVTSLAGGTTSGAPSIAIIAELPDGSFVFAETTLKLFLTAADMFKARHGDPRT